MPVSKNVLKFFLTAFCFLKKYAFSFFWPAMIKYSAPF